jgi:hypothetical protein
VKTLIKINRLSVFRTLESRLLTILFGFGFLAACATPPAKQQIEPAGVASRNAEARAESANATSGALTQFAPSESQIKTKSNESEVEKVVRARAQARWALLLKSDIDSAYEFLSPNARLAQPKDVYKSRIRSGFWISANVVRVDCQQENRCLALTDVKIKMAGMRGGPIDHVSTATEDWLFIAGQWWYVPVAQ